MSIWRFKSEKRGFKHWNTWFLQEECSFHWFKSSTLDTGILGKFQASSKGTLFTYYKSVHMGQRFPFPECDYEATRKDSLVTHHKSLHMGQQSKCLECEYQSTKKRNLARHHKSVHQSSKMSIFLCGRIWAAGSRMNKC
jgi:hypothetical protein